MTGLTLVQHEEPLAVVRLGPGSEIPDWATGATVFSVTATATETSLVCGRAGVPRKAKQRGPFTAFSVAGTIDFSLSRLLAPLAEADVPAFTISTYDTDWVLVPARSADTAVEAWRGAGLAIASADEPTDQHAREGS